MITELLKNAIRADLKRFCYNFCENEFICYSHFVKEIKTSIKYNLDDNYSKADYDELYKFFTSEFSSKAFFERLEQDRELKKETLLNSKPNDNELDNLSKRGFTLIDAVNYFTKNMSNNELITIRHKLNKLLMDKQN